MPNSSSAARTDACQNLAEQAVAHGVDAVAVRLDVTDDDSVATAVERAESRFGRLDVAFNNAGVQGPSLPLHEQDHPPTSARSSR